LVMTPKNYDPATHLHWYRKVDRHPDAAMNSLAEDFCRRVVSWLGTECPKIYWFEEANFVAASRAWLDHPGPKHDPSADPVRESCELFRWEETANWVANGYTHKESPLGIMINVACSNKDLLTVVAEECFHMYQDFVHGAGWRATESVNIVEAEAKAFVCSNSGKIQAFKEDWNRDPAS
jgi:hypothetical protein